MITLNQAKWGIQRIFFCTIIIAGMFSIGLAFYLVFPITSYYLLGNFQIRKNHKYFIPVAIYCWRMLIHWLKDKEYREMFSLPLFSPPLTSPDQTKFQLADHWENNGFDCDQCIKCCLKIDCPLLDKKNKRCLSYNSLHWRYFNCGPYPVSQKQIDYFQCTKWVKRETDKLTT